MSQYTVNTYSASDVILSFGGYSVIGWDEISVRRDTAQSNFIKGIRGKNTRIMNPNTSSVISVVCPQTSEAHAVFGQIVSGDLLTGGNARLQVILKDLNGGLVLSSNEAYVTGYPDVSYKNSIQNFTWLIQCYSAEYSGLTSRTPQSSLFDFVLGG
ncbi:hypothetical protein D3C87_323890 [compost metagenome]